MPASTQTITEAIETAERPLLVAAHTAGQLDVFKHTFGLWSKDVRRVQSMDDIVGRRHGLPIFLLPSWEQGVHKSRDIRDVMRVHGMKVFEVAEHEVRGLTEAEYENRVRNYR